jgi:hypothetical protein
MPTLDELYAKFGQVSEAAQLLETDLGTMLLFLEAVDEGMISRRCRSIPNVRGI